MNLRTPINRAVLARGGGLAWIVLTALIAVSPVWSQSLREAEPKASDTVEDSQSQGPMANLLPFPPDPSVQVELKKEPVGPSSVPPPVGPCLPAGEQGPPPTLEQLRAMIGMAGQWPSCDLNVPGPACPTPQDLADQRSYIKEFVDPKHTLTLVQGRTRLMILTEAPKRVQIGNEKIADATLMGPRELSLAGMSLGSTVLNLWFNDPADKTRDKIIGYLVRVVPDPEILARQEYRYKLLAAEIGHAFPDSHVSLSLVGEKLVVSGEAKDIAEATQILLIARANAPRQEPNKLPVDNVSVVVNTPAATNTGLNNLLQVAGPNVINMLRIPGEQQVMLRVTVAEVNRAAARSIGMNFNAHVGAVTFGNNTGNIATGGSTSLGAGNLGGIAGAVSNGIGLATNNLPVGLDNGQTTLAINALRNLNYARSLAEPNLVALNGQTAKFQAGGEFPVPVVTGATATGLQGVNFVPYGVQLSFTPYITDRSRIRLSLSAAVSTRDLAAGTTINGANVSGVTTRNFQTTIELREGQTLAVAGLIQNNLGAQSARIPFIGDLPVIGRALGFDQLAAGEQELVVLITPELVHPLEHCEVPKLPGADLFEPSDLEFYLLGRLESRRSYDYRSPVMTDLSRMCRYQRCEQIYIFGPSGHSDY